MIPQHRPCGLAVRACVLVALAFSPIIRGQSYNGWVTGSGHSGQLGADVPTNTSSPLTLATGVATAAVGSAHTVWVKTDGTLWALGGNADGQLGTGDTADRAAPVQIPSSVAITAVAAGRAHTLLLKADATLWAVGDNAYGQLGLGDTTDRHTPVQIASDVASMAAGDDHTLVVKIDGSLWACGRNTHGQLGDASTTDRATPAQIATGVTSASGAAAHSLFIKTDATLWACGQSTYGQLGTGATNSVPQTTPVQVTTGALRASAGASHSLLVKTDGTAHATGDNFFGQFGNGTQSRSYSFTPIGSGRSAVAAGLLHSLFITSAGSLLGSGDNRIHQLGGSSGASVPTAQTLATGVSAVFTRDLHSVWLTTDGTLYGLGDNRAGQLGAPASTTTSPLSLGADITAISQGVAHTLYLKSDGSLWAIGDNSYGQLGLGDTLPRTAPVQITTGVASVSAGSFHTLFVKTDGTLWATGRNDRGQLGNNSTTGRTTAAQITTGVLSASAGDNHSLFLKTDSTLWGMGDNSSYQINPNGSSSSPIIQATQVAFGVTAFSAGGAHSLYVSGGSLYSFGDNSFGQLGMATTLPEGPLRTPFKVTTGVTTVSTAYAHTLFLKTDGTLWGMGDNSSGQLGLGDTAARLLPVQIATDVASLAVGGLGRGLGAGHSLFAKRDGTLWAMGDNRFGQLGDGTRSNRLSPVQLGFAHVTTVSAGDLTSGFIQATPSSPVLTASPVSQEVEYGGYASLRVSASGGFPAYQWFVGASGDTSRPVAGATSANLLTLPVVEPTSFWVRVTNEIGSIDSATATITPRARPVATLSGAGALGYGAFDESFAATRVGVPIPLSTEIAALAHSSGHSLILKHDGTLWALGFNGSGQLGTSDVAARATPVQIASSVAACAAGSAHSLFLKTDGTLWGMGDNSRGQLGDGTTTSRRTPFQIASSVRAVAVGSSHTLFVKTDDTLWACGINTSGQLGDGTTTNRATPVQIASAVSSIAAGSSYSLFLKIDATLWATGANSVGQLGDGTTTNRATPALIATGVASCSANSSGTHSLFITTDGSLFGMGENDSGRLGLRDTVDRAIPVLIDTQVASCSAGADHSLWIKTDQSLWGAGNGEFGQLGLGVGVASAQVSPREIAAGVSQAFASVSSSHFFDTTGVLRGMGRNHLGQLIPATNSFSSPVPLAANVTAIDAVFARLPESRRLGSDDQIWSSFGKPGDADPTPGFAATGAVRLISSPIFKPNGQGIEFASGPDRLLFLRADGSLWGAGDNSTGALGTGDTTTPTTPVQIASGVADAAAAGHGTTFLKTDGSLWITGQLRSASGGGLHVFGLSPVQIDTDVRAIASSYGHVLYLKNDNSLWGIGDSIYRQLGVSAAFGTMITTPVRITGDVIRFAAGQRHTLLIKRDGTLWACGFPIYGQLGITSNSQGLSLTQVTTGVAEVVTTAETSFIIKTDGTVWAAGQNSYGQLGTINTTNTSTFMLLFAIPGRIPQPVPGVAKIIPALSGEATFFLKTDGTLLGTGRNDRGQLGLGHTNVVNVPTLIRNQAYAVAASGLHTLFLHEPAPLAPLAIVSQPTSQTFPFGSFATLSVGVSGGELLTYQWYQGASGDTSRPVTGATDSTLRLPAFAGTATYWARVTNPAGTTDTVSATLTVTGSGTPAFRAWAEAAGLSGSRLSVTADADGDGLANLLEYAFASAPEASHDHASPVPQMMQTGEGAFLVLTHRRLKDAALSFVYETSSDLSSWAPESLTPTVIDPDADKDGRVEEVVVALPLTPATPPRFLRVRVSTP